MPNAFEAARDVIFANEDRAIAAQYFSEEDAEPRDLRIILGFDQSDAGLFQTDASVDGNKLWVRKAELADQPPENSFFVAGERKLVVRTAVTDKLDLWWIVDVDERAIGS